MEENSLVALTEEYLMSKIYVIRGVQVMLDVDLAVIYGYTTKNFNRQVKNNIDRFDDDFRFQLTDIEVNILRCKNCTSSWGGARYLPYAFTELGIYALMMVLKGNLAIDQSKKLIRLFKKLKDYAFQIQNILPSSDMRTLAIQTQRNTEDIRQIQQQVNDLTIVIKDFTDPNIKKDDRVS